MFLSNGIDSIHLSLAQRVDSGELRQDENRLNELYLEIACVCRTEVRMLYGEASALFRLVLAG